MTKISIFTKTGGGDKANSLNNFILSIRRNFQKFEETLNVEPSVQLHLEIRLDGDVLIYDDPPGCSHLKFLRKKNVIANTIAIKKPELVSLEKAKAFLKKNILIAFEQMIDRLLKEKFVVDKEKFMKKIEAGLDKLD